MENANRICIGRGEILYLAPTLNQANSNGFPS
jgi:hypothetical protein